MRTLLIFALAASGYCQQTGVIQRALSSVAAATASPALTNYGQVGHSAYLFFSDAPGHTCSNPNGSAQLEYSVDDSAWFPFGSPQSGTSAMNAQAYVGSGPFAYVRFNLISFDTTNCRATAWYGGTARPLSVQLAGPIGSSAALILADRTISVSTGATTSTTIISASSTGSTHITSFIIQSSGAATAQLSYGSSSGAGCIGGTGGTDILPPSTIAAGTNQFGTGAIGQIADVRAGDVVCFQSPSGSFSVTVSYGVF